MKIQYRTYVPQLFLANTLFLKSAFFLCALFWWVVPAHAQTYGKINALTTLVYIPNVGVETSIGKNLTFQADVTVSLWQSVNGGPFQFMMLFPEVRYHFKEKFNGLYFGPHIGGSVYKLQKWNYSDTKYYQEGMSVFYGATLGYEWKINEKFMIDVFLGGGNQQGYYKGYDGETGERYEKAKNRNKSGEWLPYRGGVMLCYKL